MKTEKEIEQLKDYMESNIYRYRRKAEGALRNRNNSEFEEFNREFIKAVAQYEILLEVLR